MEHDELIDRAIASYSLAEAPAGFGERVLRAIHRKRRASQWAWVPLTAAAAIGSVWLIPARVPRAATVPVAAMVPSGSLVPKPEVVRTTTRERKRRSRGLAVVRGWSNQERSLVHWVALSPETAVAEWTDMKERLEAPLEIKSLEIQPIAIEERER